MTYTPQIISLVKWALHWQIPFQLTVTTDGQVWKTYENGKAEPLKGA